jgi:hypothetical protein
MTKAMLSNQELYKIYRKHVASDGLIDMMDMGQFLDAARDVMRTVQVNDTEQLAENNE